jgi:hypothetical protein
MKGDARMKIGINTALPVALAMAPLARGEPELKRTQTIGGSLEAEWEKNLSANGQAVASRAF